MKLKEILIIDDDRLILDTLKDALEIEGYPVVTAQNGKEAVKHLKKCTSNNLPGLILLDLRMPVLSGFEFLKEVKTHNSNYKHIPVILTGGLQHSLKSEVSSLIVDLMEKPWDLDELYSRVEFYYKPSAQLMAG